MRRACVKIGFEMMFLDKLYQVRDFFIFDKKSCEMMFGDMHEHITKQSSLGHKISFFSLFIFFFVTTGFEMMFFDSGALARAKRSTLNNKIWLSMHPRNFDSDKIVCTTYVPYVHTLTWITEKELEQEIKEKHENFIAALENEKCYSSHQNKNERQ